MIGARHGLSRVNAVSYWLPPALLLILVNRCSADLTLAGPPTHPQPAGKPGPAGVHLTFITLGVSSIISAVNFLVTVARLRTVGMSLMRMPTSSGRSS